MEGGAQAPKAPPLPTLLTCTIDYNNLNLTPNVATILQKSGKWTMMIAKKDAKSSKSIINGYSHDLKQCIFATLSLLLQLPIECRASC